VAVNH